MSGAPRDFLKNSRIELWKRCTSVAGVNRRQALILLGGAGALVLGVPLGWSAYTAMRFPSDRTPEGSYLRIVIAFGKGRVRDAFPYLEAEAKHAICTIHEFRAKALAKVRSSFEEPERSRLEKAYREEGDAVDPPAVWELLAAQRGWDARMRKDLSGIATVERVGKRASIETVRGTRYPFREADDGIWGLTLFTAELQAHKERAARDFQLVENAANDYERTRSP